MDFTRRELVYIACALEGEAERAARSVREGTLDKDQGMKRHAEIFSSECARIAKIIDDHLSEAS